MNRQFLYIFIIAGLLILSSCASYYISVDSLKQQFEGIDPIKYKDVEVRGPIGEIYRYPANPITTIKCVDKKGHPMQLRNSPSIEIRITYGENKKRTVFYFDRIYVNDSSVSGVESRFFESIKKTIPLNTISKIEVQDGRKNFHYVNNSYH